MRSMRRKQPKQQHKGFLMMKGLWTPSVDHTAPRKTSHKINTKQNNNHIQVISLMKQKGNTGNKFSNRDILLIHMLSWGWPSEGNLLSD